jgi:hypothetical protein
MKAGPKSDHNETLYFSNYRKCPWCNVCIYIGLEVYIWNVIKIRSSSVVYSSDDINCSVLITDLLETVRYWSLWL